MFSFFRSVEKSAATALEQITGVITKYRFQNINQDSFLTNSLTTWCPERKDDTTIGLLLLLLLLLLLFYYKLGISQVKSNC